MNEDEFFTGMQGLIRQVIWDALTLDKAQADGITPKLVQGLAADAAAQIMQNIKAEFD